MRDDRERGRPGPEAASPSRWAREEPPDDGPAAHAGFGDWLLSGVSTQLLQEIAGFDDPIQADHDDYAPSGRKSPSLIRWGFLAVLPESRLLGVIGLLAPERQRRRLERVSVCLVR